MAHARLSRRRKKWLKRAHPSAVVLRGRISDGGHCKTMWVNLWRIWAHDDARNYRFVRN